MISVVQQGFKTVLKVDPCSSSSTGGNFMVCLDDLLDRLDDRGIQVDALCFDAATSTWKSLRHCGALIFRSISTTIKLSILLHAL